MYESIIDILTQGRDREAQSSKIYGLVIGIVTNNKDPDKLGRVKVKFPWLDDHVESWWARLAYPMGGKERGFWFLPEIEDEVLIGFEHGDVRFPYVVGSLYNGKDTPPRASDVTGGSSDGELNADGKNDLRFIRSRSGHVIILDDKAGEEKVTVVDKTGNHKIEIDSKNKKIVLTSSDGDIEIRAKKKVIIDCETLETHSSQDTTVSVDRHMNVDVKKNMGGNVGQGASFKSGQSTKVEAGTNLDMKSGSGATLKGGTTMDVAAGAKITCKGASAEFSASGVNTVKGATVQIN